MPTQKYVPHARLSCPAIQGIARTLAMPTQKYVPHARLSCPAIQSIARTLKTLEERSGQSRESFARQIGVTPLTYRRLVAGTANPMILLLHSIACRLGITLEQLLGFEPLDGVTR